MKAKLTTIILAYNEEQNISDCIHSIKDISDRIVVVDSYSNDGTQLIAKNLGAEVYENKFINQAKQLIFAFKNLNIESEWVLRLDADERISEAAKKEIREIFDKNEPDVNGVVIPFEVNFMGKKLRHGGIFPFKKLSLFRNGYAKIENRQMDEHFYLLSGRAIELKSISEHHDFKDLSRWIEKHNSYSTRETIDYYKRKDKPNDSVNIYKTAKFKRFIKYNIYYKLPMGMRSYIYYIYRYYIKLGFLDGKEGKIFAFLQAYWYRFLVDAKIFEQEINRRSDDEKDFS